MKKKYLASFLLATCLAMSSAFCAFAGETDVTNQLSTLAPNETEGKLNGRTSRAIVTDTADGKHVTHDSYYVRNNEKAAARAWTTITKDKKNVYHTTGAKIGENWVYIDTAEKSGYGKTTATTKYIVEHAQITMTSYWNTK